MRWAPILLAASLLTVVAPTAEADVDVATPQPDVDLRCIGHPMVTTSVCVDGDCIVVFFGRQPVVWTAGCQGETTAASLLTVVAPTAEADVDAATPQADADTRCTGHPILRYSVCSHGGCTVVYQDNRPVAWTSGCEAETTAASLPTVVVPTAEADVDVATPQADADLQCIGHPILRPSVCSNGDCVAIMQDSRPVAVVCPAADTPTQRL